ncbi:MULTISPECIES: HypC/HybG/HupF family hydrogenase formation chaperone [unclassified Corynebacterium]|uniref:HypC/HybG/HupF family hydrogenase formation chaperone n=1 Tax=unclassified Corynebacterium TaxID=2624378 RepID=UPI0030B12D9A
MCIGIPGKVVELTGNSDSPLPMAVIDVAGQTRQCCVAYVPDVHVGQYVLFQNGFAMSILDEESAQESLDTIHEFNLIQRTDTPPSGN